MTNQYGTDIDIHLAMEALFAKHYSRTMSERMKRIWADKKARLLKEKTLAGTSVNSKVIS